MLQAVSVPCADVSSPLLFSVRGAELLAIVVAEVFERRKLMEDGIIAQVKARAEDVDTNARPLGESAHTTGMQLLYDEFVSIVHAINMANNYSDQKVGSPLSFRGSRLSLSDS